MSSYVIGAGAATELLRPASLSLVPYLAPKDHLGAFFPAKLPVA